MDSNQPTPQDDQARRNSSMSEQRHRRNNQRPPRRSPNPRPEENTNAEIKQTNQHDRYSRPSLSYHGASPHKGRAPGQESRSTASQTTQSGQQNQKRTYFSSEQLHAKRTNDRTPQQPRHTVGPNPRLAAGRPAPVASSSRPKQGQTRQPQETTSRPLSRRRFSPRQDNKYAVVEEIQSRAETHAPKPVTLSSASKLLKIIPLGGAGEVGAKNMTVFEYGEDIVVIDCGIGFADKDLPGIDAVIPDTTYLEERKASIRGMVFTHGHEDHIGSVPYIWPKLQCPMYSTPLTAGLINHKLEEAGLTNASVTIVNAGDILHFGKISVEMVRLTHSIPDVLGLAIRCPDGLFFYCTDWRIEHRPVLGKPADWTRIAQLAGEGITALFSDSTNVDRPGYSPSEQIIAKAFDEIFSNAKGRIILAQFSSQINRIQQALDAAKKYGRKVALSGRSMETYVNVAMNLGYLKVPEGMMVDLRKINTLDPHKIAILSTGSQGEEFSSLTRISEGEHRHVKLNKTDTVVIAASAVPGNEIAVAKMIDNLYREGANVIVNKDMDVHVSGHPSREELRFMISICKPEYFVPIHGDYRMIVEHGKLAVEQGVDPNKVIIMENGMQLFFDDKGGRVADEKVHVGDVLIDGLGVGDIGPIVIRDRQAMAKEGMVTIFMVVKQKTGEMLTSPDIISRGFIYMREAEEFMQKLRNEIRTSFERNYKRVNGNSDELKQAMRDDLSKFINEATGRNPMVIPVIVTI